MWIEHFKLCALKQLQYHIHKHFDQTAFANIWYIDIVFVSDMHFVGLCGFHYIYIEVVYSEILLLAIVHIATLVTGMCAVCTQSFNVQIL